MKLYLNFLCCLLSITGLCQSKKPDLHDKSLWTLHNRLASYSSEGDKKLVSLSEAERDGLMYLNQDWFSLGTIEFDVKGRDVAQKSFVGFAFQIQNDSTFEAIYFRPFNFMNADTSRRARSVQYICQPNFPWNKLRAEHPGVYENKTNPVPGPDDWFHVRILVETKTVSVYVNRATTASLVVNRLASPGIGKLGFFAGSNSNGSFANFSYTSKVEKRMPGNGGAKINYGNNPAAGNYVDVGDAKLYYEVYGSGQPFVLLHGGVYGYIDEFEPFIKTLSDTYKVICVATRGHGKSEIGKKPFSWKQRAEDAYSVIKHITNEPVTVLGFSDGAYTGYTLAAAHPELVKKLIAIGAGERSKTIKTEKLNFTPEMLLRDARDFFEARLSLMPEPDRWGEVLNKLNDLYNKEYLSRETYARIECPTLIMGGDRDEYHLVQNLQSIQTMIPRSQLSIINGCGHAVFFCNWDSVWSTVNNFLESSF